MSSAERLWAWGCLCCDAMTNSSQPTTPIKHDDLMYRLADHLRGTGDRMVWTDMQLGPVWSPRPDVWTLSKSYTDPNPRAYECKISVADFRRDITSGKWQDYLKHSRAVTFATPAGLIDKKELPQGCGLMTWNGETWRTIKAPTLNVCPALPREVMMKLLIDGISRAEEASRLRLRDKWMAEESIRQKLGDKVAEIVRDELSIDARIKAMKESYASEREQEEKRSKEARDHREQLGNAIWGNICRTLGLPETASTWTVDEKVRELADAVSKDREVSNLTMRIRAIEDAIARANKTPNAELQRRFTQPA